MAQEEQELRSVNWNEVFAFTHLFKCFRMAIQPSKLVLSAAALVLLFLAGWGMDWLWGGIGREYALVGPGPAGEAGEIATSTGLSPSAFTKWRDKQVDGRRGKAIALKVETLTNAQLTMDFITAWGVLIGQDTKYAGYGQLLSAYNKKLQEKNKDAKLPVQAEIKNEAEKRDYSWSRLKGEAREAFASEVKRIEELLEDARKDAAGVVDNLASGTDAEKTTKEEAKEALGRHMDCARQALTLTKNNFRGKVLVLTGMGISQALATYEWNCVREAVRAASRGNFTGGLDQYRDRMALRRDVTPIAVPEGGLQAPPTAGAAPGEGGGVLYYALMAGQGVCWLVRAHWLYALIYLVIALAIVAIFGGAVNRMAALHFAREEKISAGQAVKFAFSKFLSFFTAPLIPMAIILILGVLLAVGGLIINIPGVGQIIAGALFFLALLGGLGIAFLLTGLVGGAGLMYPTIAAEGSDSFDAISRSYSYVFARPWRAILYGAVAAVYGAITYTFVRLFAFVALAATHWFVGKGVFWGGGDLSAKANKLDVLWSMPTMDNLLGDFSWDAMGGLEPVGAWLIGIWVFLLACVVAGYLLSYAASATTVIYFLLRRKVDATDLDDVYVEEATEEATAAPEAAPAAAAPAVPAAPAAPAGGEAQTPPGGARSSGK